MINLAVDRLSPIVPERAADIRAAIIAQPRVYTAAASRIGLTPREFREFRRALDDGNVTFVRLPRHIDAMSGSHHGRVYALHDVIVPAGTRGWRVALTDGADVFVPEQCGNLSMNRNRPARQATSTTRSVATHATNLGYFQSRHASFAIVFDDQAVLSMPDVLKRGRALAPLVKDGRIYVPLRAMFEQLGAAVTASDDGNTISALKSGTRVSLTLGKTSVVINGASRPIDVAPMLYNHTLLVPLRVLAEALGAYVQWLPGRAVVVVHSTPGAAALSPSISVPPGTIIGGITTLDPASTVGENEHTSDPNSMFPPSRGFVQAAIWAPHNYTEFSAGQHCPESYVLSGAYELNHSKFAVKVDYRQAVYVTNDNVTGSLNNRFTSFPTIDGGTALAPVFLARQGTLDTRLEYQIGAPHFYVGASYLHAGNNYGYPQLNAAGVGVEKLPDLRSGLNFFGSTFYYPAVDGTYTITNPRSPNVGRVYRQRYAAVRYDIGLAYVLARSPAYLFSGFGGERFGTIQNAPVTQLHVGPYAGLGFRL
jgi:hypothetical protein